MSGIDLRDSEPRSPHELLGGVKLLARIIDKARATLLGTNGPYVFYDCALDRVFFDDVKATRDEFMSVIVEGYASNIRGNMLALDDLRESLENEPEVTNETFLEHASAADVDHAAVRWLQESVRITPATIAEINLQTDQLSEEALNDRVSR